MLAFYPRFAFDTVRAHFWMAYWLARMAIMRWRVNRDTNRMAYSDLALETVTAERNDNLELFEITRWRPAGDCEKAFRGRRPRENEGREDQIAHLIGAS